MRMSMRLTAVVALLPLMMGVGTLYAAGSDKGQFPPPDKVVEMTADGILAAIHDNHGDLKAHPQKLYDLIAHQLLPHFDFEYASRIVLGRYWRTATPKQRKDFEQAFYNFLVHSYANGMLKGNISSHDIVVEPWRGNPDDTRAMIRSKVMRSGAAPVEVDYAMVRTKDGWKAFDVTIEGISYVMNYRNQFGPEIEDKGLDALIKRLNASANQASVPARTVPGGA